MAKKKKKGKPRKQRPPAPPPLPPRPPAPLDEGATEAGAQDRQLEVITGNTDLIMIELLATVNKNLCVIQSQLAKIVDHLTHED
jgi:hypothetical protein